MHLAATVLHEAPLAVHAHHARAVPTGLVVADEPGLVEQPDLCADLEVQLHRQGCHGERFGARRVRTNESERREELGLQGSARRAGRGDVRCS